MNTKNSNGSGTDGNAHPSASGASGQAGLFAHAPPEGHAKKTSEVLGEITWLMSQSPLHKRLFIQDLEWFVMTPILLQQFRLFYDQQKPIGVVLWAHANEDVAEMLGQGISKLRPQDWQSGDEVWVVEAIAPFGGGEEMVKDLKANVFAEQDVRYLATDASGQSVRVV